MTAEGDLRSAAQAFLSAVAEKAKAKLGPSPVRQQVATWMVPKQGGSASSTQSKRTVFDVAGVSSLFQRESRRGFPEQDELVRQLVAAGIPEEDIYFGFLYALITHWLQVPSPFSTDDLPSDLLDDFVVAALEGRVTTTSRDVIALLQLPDGAASIGDNAEIRPVSSQELWQWGDVKRPVAGINDFDRMPSEGWTILEIRQAHELRSARHPGSIESLRTTALLALVLGSPGHFRLTSVGATTTYRLGAVGSPTFGLSTTDFNTLQAEPYVLDSSMTQRIRDAWPRLNKIVRTSDYLRFPAQQLMDGGRRDRPEEAILDYSMGLEALLTRSADTELKYCFSLRGAHVLGWQGEGRQDHLRDLRALYDLRSKIVHGGKRPPQLELKDMRSTGAEALRKVWWWFFDRGVSHEEATRLIDERVLS